MSITRDIPKSIKYLSHLKKLDTQLHNEIEGEHSLITVHKTTLLNALKKSLAELKEINGVTYKDFIGLFNIVRKSKTLNWHNNPSWDAFWKWRLTATLGLCLSYVRDAALDVFERYVAEEKGTFEDRKKLATEIKEAMKLDLFRLPLSNWAFFAPPSCEKLQTWANYFNEPQYQSIVFDFKLENT